MVDTFPQTVLFKCLTGRKKMTNRLKSKSFPVSDWYNLQVTGSNRLQTHSRMWEVNRNRQLDGNENEARPEMVRLSLDSSFSLLRSDFGFKRERTDTFEGISRQNRHDFYIESDCLEEKFRQVASRHLGALQTSGSRLSASEADSAIGRLRMVLCPAKVNGFGKRANNHFLPIKEELSERKLGVSVERDRKEKIFISGISSFKNNYQPIKKYFNAPTESQNTGGSQLLKVNGTNIAKKKQ